MAFLEKKKNLQQGMYLAMIKLEILNFSHAQVTAGKKKQEVRIRKPT